MKREYSAKNRLFFDKASGDPILRQLDGFGALDQGWHFGKGGPISESTIKTAKKLYEALLLNGLTRTEVFPGVDGEILIIGYALDHDVELVCENGGSIRLIHSRNDKEMYECNALDVLSTKKELRGISNKIWNVSDYSAQGTIAPRRDGTSGWRLRTQRTAYRSFQHAA